jgi:hypothetical protein
MKQTARKRDTVTKPRSKGITDKAKRVLRVLNQWRKSKTMNMETALSIAYDAGMAAEKRKREEIRASRSKK